MKNKSLLMIGFYIIVIGWFPYMLLCVWGLNQEPIYRAVIILVGVSFCLFGSMMVLPLLKNDDLFKSIDELEREKVDYKKATEKLYNKIREL